MIGASVLISSKIRHSNQAARVLAAAVILVVTAATISCRPDPKPQRAGARGVPVTVGSVTQQPFLCF